MVKKYGRHEISSIQVLIFVSACVVVFRTSIFLFQRAFYYFIGRYCFVEDNSFKNICQLEIFVTVYLPKECLLNKQSLSLYEVSKSLRIFKKPCFLNEMPFLHNYTQKGIISRKISPWPQAFIISTFTFNFTYF